MFSPLCTVSLDVTMFYTLEGRGKITALGVLILMVLGR
jgi:hypothetical protein